MPATIDNVGSHVALVMSTILGVQPFVSERKLRALAVTTAKRSAVMPGIPTLVESGVTGYEASSWNSLLAPEGDRVEGPLRTGRPSFPRRRESIGSTQAWMPASAGMTLVLTRKKKRAPE